MATARRSSSSKCKKSVEIGYEFCFADDQSEGSESEGEEDTIDYAQEISEDISELTLDTDFTPNFSWIRSNFMPNLFKFIGEPGVSSEFPCTENSQPIDFFENFFDKTLMTFIMEQTNLYHDQNSSVYKNSHMAEWYDSTVSELYVMIATILLMSHITKHKIRDYWSTNYLLETRIFGKLFTRDRFRSLLSCLHFCDNNNGNNVNDPLNKIRTIYNIIKHKFQAAFYPYKNICIDESLMLYKGRLYFKQYIPSKRSRFGIKFFVLCDCKTGYILQFIIYTGKSTEINLDKQLGITGSLVTNMMEKYNGKGHVIYMDNFYTSPILFEYLYNKKVGACGTVKSNRIGLPKFDNQKSGQMSYYNTNKLLYMKWTDKRDVHMLSSIHQPNMTTLEKINPKTNQNIVKPDCVLDYNKNMGLVDKSDMMMHISESIRKSTKWYKKLFIHIIDMTILNCFILYKEITKKNISFIDFSMQIIGQIIEKYGFQVKTQRGRPSLDNPSRLIERHFISTIPENKQRRCVVCSAHNIAKKTRYECTECNVGLCIDVCFKNFHTLKDY
ncbi:unnamed protein product [Didymodactylos carnosus]|uniref:PiggyBac transposable element-derived protein 4-like n=1 Tax=Didymodactylos carnosus TaxID=1234261 RepID=A0A813THU1_9BILA|nr:unnamed protein product [Didymodactylos carnosus]CAF0969595.1 unnamed protein product [Didymodactylos carnosus]CAF3600767.1 unnamed protein product [Didymodactylos carnosus]CAF3741109.1 unnamed protein product [Didymodactylos carnosus]